MYRAVPQTNLAVMQEKPEVRSRPRRRWLKWGIRIVVAGVGLVILGVVCSVKPVDNTPYFTTHYY